MFVRIVWNTHSARQCGWRGSRQPSRMTTCDLGIPPPDFAKMTKGLFDRPG